MITPARFYFGQPATTNATLYTVSSTSGSWVIVKEITVNNTTGTAATISIGINGTPATASNAIMSAYSVAANSVVVFALCTILNASDTLQGLQGTTGALTVVVSGVTGP